MARADNRVCRSMRARLRGRNTALRGEVDCKTPEPMAAFVMFAGHGGESGATVARRLRLATRRGVDRR